jgi:SAM-dependent methyltransferase
MTKINLEIPDCPVCSHSQFETVLSDLSDHIWHKPGLFNIGQCQNCKLVMTRPRPTAESLAFYYDNTYSGEDQAGMAGFHQGGIMRLISRYRIRAMEKVRRVRSEDFVLDVGCSYGGFLTAIAQNRGCAGVGIDLDEGAIEQAAQSHSLEFKVSEITTLDTSLGQYEWVTFWESLEHHVQPVEALAKAHALLKDDGLCCVEVPNFGGFWRRVFGRYWLPLLMPQHLFHFTPDSLVQTGKAAGFKLCHHQTMFYPLEGVASLGIALARLLKSPPPGSPLSWRTPFDILIFLCLVVLYFVAEIPSQFVLNLMGQSGHQFAVFQKMPAGTGSESEPMYAPEPKEVHGSEALKESSSASAMGHESESNHSE